MRKPIHIGAVMVAVKDRCMEKLEKGGEVLQTKVVVGMKVVSLEPTRLSRKHSF